MVFQLHDHVSGPVGTLILAGRRAELLYQPTGERLVLGRSFHLDKLLHVTEYWRYADSERVFAHYEGSWKANAEFVLEGGDSYQVRLDQIKGNSFRAVWFRDQVEEVVMELMADGAKGWFRRLDRVRLSGTIRTEITDIRLILVLLLFMQDAMRDQDD